MGTHAPVDRQPKQPSQPSEGGILKLDMPGLVVRVDQHHERAKKEFMSYVWANAICQQLLKA
jgi:hypothetical protein